MGDVTFQQKFRRIIKDCNFFSIVTKIGNIIIVELLIQSKYVLYMDPIGVIFMSFLRTLCAKQIMCVIFKIISYFEVTSGILTYQNLYKKVSIFSFIKKVNGSCYL